MLPEPLPALLDALAWKDLDRARALLDGLPRGTVDELALHAACAARFGGIAHATPANDLAWLGLECGDVRIRAMCALLPRNLPTPPHVAAAERAWSLLVDVPWDPLVGYVRLMCASVWLVTALHPERRAAVLEEAWAHRDTCPGAAAVGAFFAVDAALEHHDLPTARRWAESGAALAEGRAGWFATVVRAAAVTEALHAGDLERAEAALARVVAQDASFPVRSTLPARVLLARGEVEAAVATLEALAEAPTAPNATAFWLAVAHLAAGRPQRARRAIDPLRTSTTEDIRTWVELVDLGAGADADLAWLQRALPLLPPVAAMSGVLEAGAAAATRPDRAARALHLAAQLVARRDAGAGLDLVRAGPPDGPLPVGVFDLEEPIGRGANAVVYAARHHHLGIPAALKVLTAPRLDATVLQEEGRLLARLRHPNILQILGWGEIDALAAAQSHGRLNAGSAWLATEFVTGGTLEGVRLDGDALVDLVLALLDALAHAHAAGVLHLDLKPANLLVSEAGGRRVPKLADFGVFALLRSVSGRISGSPAYMPPEQWQEPDRLAPTADLYALGLVAWELWSGERPFAAAEVAACRALHRSADRPGFEAIGPELAGWLRTLNARDPADRFPSAHAAAHALRSAVGRPAGPLVPEVPPVAWGANSPLLPPALAAERFDVGPVFGADDARARIWTALRERVEGGPVGEVTVGGPGVRALCRGLLRAARQVGLPAVDRSETPALPERGLVLSTEAVPDPGARVLVVRRVQGPAGIRLAPSVADAARTLQDRLPLATGLADDLVHRAGGDPDLALDRLRKLVADDALELRGRTWDSLSGALDREHGLDDRLAHVLSGDEVDGLGAAVLADVPARPHTGDETHERLVALDLLMADGRVVPAARSAFEERFRTRLPVLDAALGLATDPVARARILALRGDVGSALDVLLDHAERCLFEFGDPDPALRMAASLPVEMPRRYDLLRGLALKRHGETAASRPYLRRATLDPALAERALLNLADAVEGPERIALFRQAAAAARTPESRAHDLAILGDALAAEGRMEEAAEALSEALVVPGLHPPRSYALWLLLPETFDPVWLDRVAAIRDIPGGRPIFVQRLVWIEQAARLVWRGEPPDPAALDPRMLPALEALWAVHAGEPEVLERLLASSRGATLMLDPWAWALWWWLEAEVPDARWATVVERWPAHRWSPLDPWLLERVAARAASVARRLEIDAVRREHRALGNVLRGAVRWRD